MRRDQRTIKTKPLGRAMNRFMLLAIAVFVFATAAACGSDDSTPANSSNAGRGFVESPDSTPVPIRPDATTTPDPSLFTEPLIRRVADPKVDGPFVVVTPVVRTFDDIPKMRAPDREPPTTGGDKIVARISELVPGFSDIYRTNRELVIVLGDIADREKIERAIAAVAAFYGPGEFTHTIRIELGEPEVADLRDLPASLDDSATASTPRPFIDVPGVIKSFPDIPEPRGPNLDPPYLTGNQLLERIAEMVPGFGGIYMSGTLLVIVLNDDSQVDRAIAAVAAFYGADRITENVRIERGTFDIANLVRWYGTAQDIVWQFEGVYRSGLNERLGRIEFGVDRQKTADLAKEALKETGIPAAAVFFEVPPPRMIADYVPNARTPLGIEIEFEFPEQVEAGEPVTFAIVLTNRANRTTEISYLATSRSDFVLFAEGVDVWSKNGRAPTSERLRGERVRLFPGDSKRFETVWNGLDYDQQPLPPGEYVIVAMSRGSEDSDGLGASWYLATEPQAITIAAR